MRNHHRTGKLLLSLGLVLLLAACAEPKAITAPAGVTLTPLRTISKLEGRLMLKLAGVSGISVEHAVDCYRVLYRTQNAKAEQIVVSGLLAMPHAAPANQLVSFQHGTTTVRDAVPSALDVTGKAVALTFAGNGYAVIAPDYIGLGASEERHPYLVAEDAARVTADMISAARRIPDVPDGPVFLSGFSQGGQATIAALRTLESAGESVLGAAPVAGPYDIRNVSLGAALRGGSPSHAVYLAYMSWGYSARYSQPIDSVLSPSYAKVVNDLFGATHDSKTIMAALPIDPREMFNESFLEAFDSGKQHWLLDSLAQSNVRDWAPRAPVRLYYGSADADVIPDEAIQAERAMRARGGDVRAIDVGPYAHDPSLLAAAPLILSWLAELETAGARSTRSP